MRAIIDSSTRERLAAVGQVRTSVARRGDLRHGAAAQRHHAGRSHPQQPFGGAEPGRDQRPGLRASSRRRTLRWMRTPHGARTRSNSSGDPRSSILRRSGDDYLRRVAGYPRNRPRFIDKTPWNFLYLGLIALALPRRAHHPPAARSDGQLLCALQDAVPLRLALFLRSGRPGALLPRLRPADGSTGAACCRDASWISTTSAWCNRRRRDHARAARLVRPAASSRNAWSSTATRRRPRPRARRRCASRMHARSIGHLEALRGAARAARRARYARAAVAIDSR